MLFKLVLQVVIGDSVSCMFTLFCVTCVADEGFKWLSFEDMFICGGGSAWVLGRWVHGT